MNVKVADLIFQLKDLSQSVLFQVLIVIIFFDTLTGIGKAIIHKRLNSDIGIKGLIKHIIVISLQTIVGLYCRVLGVTFFSYSLCTFFIGFYGISLLENAIAIGVPLPENLKEVFEQLQKKTINIPNADIIIKSNQTNSIDMIGGKK